MICHEVFNFFIFFIGGLWSFESKLSQYLRNVDNQTRKTIFPLSFAGVNQDSDEATSTNLLYFWTGSTTIPPGGFQDGLEVQYLSDTEGSILPKANACFNQLKLPLQERRFFQMYEPGHHVQYRTFWTPLYIISEYIKLLYGNETIQTP